MRVPPGVLAARLAPGAVPLPLGGAQGGALRAEGRVPGRGQVQVQDGGMVSILM